jgi:hypothetical protein
LWGLTYEDCEETRHKYLITVSPHPNLLKDGHGKRVKVEEFWVEEWGGEGEVHVS